MERRIELKRGLERLDESLQEFTKIIANDAEIHAEWLWQPPRRILPSSDRMALRARAIANITRLNFEDGEIRRHYKPSPEVSKQLSEQYLSYDLAPGLISASPILISAARAVNDAKAALSPIVEELHKPDCRVRPEDDRTGEHIGKPLLRYLLRQLGRQALHLHRVKRQILVLEEAPVSVGFTWASPKRIKRISLEELRLRLDRLSGALEDDSRLQADVRILEDLERRTITEGDTIPLAWINAAHTHPKANITFADGRMVCRQAVLPVFYPGQPNTPLIRSGRLGHWPHDEEARDYLVARRRERSDRVYDYVRPLFETVPVHSTPGEWERYHVKSGGCDSQ